MNWYGNKNKEKFGLKKMIEIPLTPISQLCSEEEKITFGAYKKNMEIGYIIEE